VGLSRCRSKREPGAVLLNVLTDRVENDPAGPYVVLAVIGAVMLFFLVRNLLRP
jgi:hypothetical protein